MYWSFLGIWWFMFYFFTSKRNTSSAIGFAIKYSDWMNVCIATYWTFIFFYIASSPLIWFNIYTTCHAELNRLRQVFYFSFIGFRFFIIFIVILSSGCIFIPTNSLEPKCIRLSLTSHFQSSSLSSNDSIASTYGGWL